MSWCLCICLCCMLNSFSSSSSSFLRFSIQSSCRFERNSLRPSKLLLLFWFFSTFSSCLNVPDIVWQLHFLIFLLLPSLFLLLSILSMKYSPRQLRFSRFLGRNSRWRFLLPDFSFIISFKFFESLWYSLYRFEKPCWGFLIYFPTTSLVHFQIL